MSASAKHYNFATELYPESAIENFKDIIDSWHIKGYLSPLHCNDVNENGEIKKAHYHLLVHFDSARHTNAVREKFASIGAVGCEIIDSFTGYARYLCHLDNPEKAQYETKDVIQFGGACYQDDIKKGISSTLVYAEIMDYIDETHIKSYAQLLRYARHFRQDWFEKLCKNGIVIKDYLRSCNFDNEHSEDSINKIDTTPYKND